MNRVILAYSGLPRQLAAPLRARWRARRGMGRALRLSADACAQSRTIVGVALACRLLSEVAGRIVSPTELCYSALGKPQAPGLPQFSIAHEGAWILCALASAGEVGVDLEPLVRQADMPRWSRVFDALERAPARAPRAAPRVIVRLITALPVTSLRLRPIPLACALAS